VAGTARVVLLAALAAGCAHAPRNEPLAAVHPEAGYRFARLAGGAEADRTFVILTFSGGGTRAAALAYGVMRELAQVDAGGGRTLLDEVDVISSVSGGSFTAAYYALFRDRLFSDFEGDFLRRDVQGALKRQLLLPANWFRLPSPHYDRIDLAARWYDRHVFAGKRFADLVSAGRRPYILLNATDMGAGHRFEFSQDQFDLLCSDLGGYPVARGVAASSAFPGLLTPITLANYAATRPGPENPCGASLSLAQRNALRGRDVNLRNFMAASELASYLEDDRPYIHLLDGGVADNIGLRGPYWALTSLASPWSVVRKINNREVERVVVIVVNAQPHGANQLDQRENAPNLVRTLQVAAGTPMSHYSFETVELLREHFTDQQRDQELARACPQCALAAAPSDLVEFYDVEVAFANLPDADAALRDRLQTLPTAFALPDAAIDELLAVGPRLLRADPDFQRLVAALGGAGE
jgi:predicted acylesterase/phospholipase RssA